MENNEKVTVKMPTQSNLIKSTDEFGRLLSESIQSDYSDYGNVE